MREHLGEDLVEQKLKSYKKRRALVIRWASIVAFLAFFVVVFVGASLRHYGQAKTNVDRMYACKLELHKHTDDCYNDEGEQICGYADYCLHTHNDDCYNDEGELICELEEIKEHEHTDDCYVEVRTLICGLEGEDQEEIIEEVSEEEFIEDEELTDEELEKKELEDEELEDEDEFDDEEETDNEDELQDKEESDSKEEDEEDKITDDEASDDEEESYEAEDDSSSDDKANEDDEEEAGAEDEEDTLSGAAGDDESDSEIESTDEEDDRDEEKETKENKTVKKTVKKHEHTEDCYEVTRELVCEESKIHEHDENCFDADGKWICGQVELICHVHTKECFEYEDAKKLRNLNRRYFAETDHVKVTAIVPEEANIPEEANFKVTEITEESDPERYNEYLKQIEEMDNYSLTYLLDIGFYIGEDEIEPEAEVEITVEDLTEEVVLDDAQIIHFIDENETEVIEETEINDSTITFQSESFSAFAIVKANGVTEYQGTNDKKNAFYESPYYDNNTLLGIAGNFHVVAFESFTFNVHCAGNIAGKRVYANANFANTDMYGKSRVSYIQMYRDISQSSGSGNGDMLVLGSDHSITVNSNVVYTKDRLNTNRSVGNVSYVSKDNDTTNAPYIDLKEARNNAIAISDSLKKYGETVGNSNIKITWDSDQRLYVDIQDSSQPAVWNVKISNLNVNDYIKITNLKVGGSYLVVNVDCENKSEAWINAKVYSCFSGSGSHDKETGRRILWNFYNCPGSKIHIDREVISGTLLAPTANIYITAQLNGAVIGYDINISNAESHFYPYDGGIPSSTNLYVQKKWENVPNGGLDGYVSVVRLYRTTTESYIGNKEKMKRVDETGDSYTAVLKKDNNWSYNFTGLKTNDSKGRTIYYYAFEEYVYNWGEDVTEAFRVESHKDCNRVQTITNTYEKVVVGLDAKKYIDGKVPKDNQIFTFNLYSWDSQNAKWKLETTAQNKKEAIYFERDVSNLKDSVTVYFFIEEESKGVPSQYNYDTSGYVYAVTKSKATSNVSVIKKKLKPEYTKDTFVTDGSLRNIECYTEVVDEVAFQNTTKVTKIDVKKQWRNVAYITKPVEIEVKLYQANASKAEKEAWTDTGKTLKITQDTAWLGSFENLPMFDETGNELFYYVEESAIINADGNIENGFYETTYKNNEGITEGQIVITNTHNRVEKNTSIIVKKNWYDSNIQWTADVPESSIAFELWRTKHEIKRHPTDNETRDISISLAGNMETFNVECCNGDTIVFSTEFFYDYCLLDKSYIGSVEGLERFLKGMNFNYPTDIWVDSGSRKVTYVSRIPITEATRADVSVLGSYVQEDLDWYWNIRYLFSSYKTFVDDIEANGNSVAIKSSIIEFFGWYQITKENGWRIQIDNLPSTITENGNTIYYTYGVQEQVPENATYTLLGYFPDIKGSYENITTGEFSICNMINTTDISVEKRWYTANGDPVSDSEATEVSINVQIYQTTSPTRPESFEDSVLVGEYILQRKSVSKVYQKYSDTVVSTVKKQNYDEIDEWKFKISKLPSCDSNRNMYYYYAVESKIGENLAEETLYKTEYGTGDESITNKGNLLIKNYGTEVFDFLPSTGGKGTITFRIKKWFMSLFKFNGV